MTIKEALNLVKTTLETAVSNLEAADKVLVEIPRSVENYKLSHNRGALLIVYRGSDFQQSEIVQIVAQNRNIKIGVIAAIRKKITGMSPEEYLDFLADSLSGIEITNKLSRALTFVEDDEFLDEVEGVWYYACTVVIPTDFFEVGSR